jgi:hypothetical protein
MQSHFRRIVKRPLSAFCDVKARHPQRPLHVDSGLSLADRALSASAY